MTKLEEKLKELGYTETYYKNTWIKIVEDFYEYTILIENNNIVERWISSTTECDFLIETQKDIDYIQRLYDNLCKDIKELRKYEN